MNTINQASEEATRALDEAVAKGVQESKGVYTFFDPGISLIVLRDLPIVEKRKLFYNSHHEDWSNESDWVTREDQPRERIIRIPVEESYYQTFDEQKELLLPEEEVPSVRTVATFLVIHEVATRTRLLKDCSVRCCEKPENDFHFSVGRDFNLKRIFVGSRWDYSRDQHLTIAASRKS